MRAVVWGLLLFLMSGCAHRPIVCTLVKIDEEPAIMCADADAVKGQEIRPYSPAPSPVLPETPRPGVIPWRERHGDKTYL